MKKIFLQRVYEWKNKQAKGPAFLVDRLWPRGIKKEALKLKAWLKELAPSEGLRKWFGHKPERWEEFKRRYFKELDAKPEAWKPLAEALKKNEITLLYGAKDEAHNNAVALKEYLERT